MVYEAMARCLETPAIVAKIVPCCAAQGFEELVIGIGQRQMSVIFPKTGAEILCGEILDVVETRTSQLHSAFEVSAGVQDPQPHTSNPSGSKQRFDCSTECALVIQRIGKENGTQTSVRINNTSRNTLDGPFLGIQDANYIALAANGHNFGLPPVRQGSEKKLGGQHGIFRPHEPLRRAFQSANLRSGGQYNPKVIVRGGARTTAVNTRACFTQPIRGCPPPVAYREGFVGHPPYPRQR